MQSVLKISTQLLDLKVNFYVRLILKLTFVLKGHGKSKAMILKLTNNRVNVLAVQNQCK